MGEGAEGWERRDRLETRRHREQAAWRCQMSRTYKGCVIKIKNKIKWRFGTGSMSRAYMGLVIQQKANDKWRFGAVKCHELAACACVCMYECVHVCMHLCACICVRACVCAYVRMCAYVCMCVCVRARACMRDHQTRKTKRHTHKKSTWQPQTVLFAKQCEFVFIMKQ